MEKINVKCLPLNMRAILFVVSHCENPAKERERRKKPKNFSNSCISDRLFTSLMPTIADTPYACGTFNLTIDSSITCWHFNRIEFDKYTQSNQAHNVVVIFLNFSSPTLFLPHLVVYFRQTGTNSNETATTAAVDTPNTLSLPLLLSLRTTRNEKETQNKKKQNL